METWPPELSPFTPRMSPPCSCLAEYWFCEYSQWRVAAILAGKVSSLQFRGLLGTCLLRGSTLPEEPCPSHMLLLVSCLGIWQDSLDEWLARWRASTYTRQHKAKKRTNIRASSGIQTRDYSSRANKSQDCHWYRLWGAMPVVYTIDIPSVSLRHLMIRANMCADFLGVL